MCFRKRSGNDSGCRSSLDDDYHHFTNNFPGHRRSMAFDLAGRNWFVPIPSGHVHESSGIFCPLRLRTKSATAITVALKAGCSSTSIFLIVKRYPFFSRKTPFTSPFGLMISNCCPTDNAVKSLFIYNTKAACVFKIRLVVSAFCRNALFCTYSGRRSSVGRASDL